MGGPWSASTERKLLLCMIDPKATPRWQLIAQAMGPQFSAEACRQKYYKLRNESAKLLDDQPGSVPSTPTKRKALKSEDETKTPPSKRARKPKRDPLDGELFSDAGSSPTEAKTNNEIQTVYKHVCLALYAQPCRPFYVCLLVGLACI
ncbi:hypothetical protein ABEF95_006346 [Exophiala dermatitidis]